GRRQREPGQERRGTRAVGAVVQLPEEREHSNDSRAGAEDRGRNAEDEELRTQEPQRNQGDPAYDGPEPRHARRSGHREPGLAVMRHRVAHRKLGRVTEHRIAMLRNQATALLLHEHLTTTVPRAKELRPFVERIITIAKRGVAKGTANGHTLNARRMVMHDLQDREVVTKLFDTLAPRFAERPGGYTRLLRLGF